MNVRVCADLQAVAHAAAEEFVRIASDAVARRGRFAVALSGGSTPRTLHARLADPSGPYRGHIDWTAWHLFWGDDRHVPPDHEDSNYRMARETLLNHVPIPEAQIHRMRTELPAGEAADDYERELRAFFVADAFPRFDLVLLGMGPDGHTASLFPGPGAVRETARWVIAPWVEKLRTFRVTLSPPAINAAAHAMFVVAGSDKADVLKEVLEGPRDPDRLPAQIVAPSSGSLLWIVDRAAGARLS